MFAGAGTEDKRTYLRSLGLVHVFDSRSLSFADEVLSATASRGVDVLLNVRGDAFISKGLSVLAPYGHFIELGLHNVYSETALHLRELEKGIRFFTLRFSPEVAEFSALLSDVLELFRSGMLQPLPYRCFAAAEAASAFALLQQGEAIGKLVLTFREGERSELLPSGIPAPMRARPRPGLRPPPRPKVQTPSPAAPALPAGQRGGLRSGLLPRPSLATPYRAPQTEIEKKLCAIWQSLLGIDGVGVDDDFVDLGGDSLLGVALLGQVRGQLQATLPAHQLLETPTIAALARVIEQQSSDPAKESAADPVLVMLRAAAAQKGQAAPAALFLLHPIDGNVHIYRQLAQTLGPEQPVYALKPPEKEGGAEPLRSVPEMAARYLRAIRKVQPQGPYALGGASFGGMLAYELSQQLFEQGQQVRFVALFDTPGPGDLPALFKEDAEIFAYLNHLGGHFPESAEAREAFLRVWKTNSRAMWEYSPRPPAKRAPLPPFRVLYFRAQQRDVVNSPTPERYWVNLLKTSAPEPSSFELHDVPGNHITMNHAPHVKVIAEILRRYLF